MRTYKHDVYLHFEPCHMCGTKNKMRAVLVHRLTGKEIGYVVRCCNCGNTRKYIADNDTAFNSFLANDFKISRKECHRTGECTHTDCPLYNVKTEPPIIYYTGIPSDKDTNKNENQITAELVSNDEINKKFL